MQETRTEMFETQYAETLGSWRAEQAQVLEGVGAMVAALLHTGQVQAEWHARLRACAGELLDLARRACRPMARHPSCWLLQFERELLAPRRLLRMAARWGAGTTGVAGEDLDGLITALDRMAAEVRAMADQLDGGRVAAGGAA